MAVLIDLDDEKVRAFLKRAQEVGSVTHDELNSHITASEVSIDDLDDTLSLLSEMGIELTDGLTQEERDRQDDAFYDSMQAWTADGRTLPQLTGDGWARLLRAIERKKA
jgi:hypothetical protein